MEIRISATAKEMADFLREMENLPDVSKFADPIVNAIRDAASNIRMEHPTARYSHYSVTDGNGRKIW